MNFFTLFLMTTLFVFSACDPNTNVETPTGADKVSKEDKGKETTTKNAESKAPKETVNAKRLQSRIAGGWIHEGEGLELTIGPDGSAHLVGTPVENEKAQNDKGTCTAGTDEKITCTFPKEKMVFVLNGTGADALLWDPVIDVMAFARSSKQPEPTLDKTAIKLDSETVQKRLTGNWIHEGEGLELTIGADGLAHLVGTPVENEKAQNDKGKCTADADAKVTCIFPREKMEFVLNGNGPDALLWDPVNDMMAFARSSK